MSMQKKSIFFLIPAFIIAVSPVLSQVNFASQKSGSLISSDKKFVDNTPRYVSSRAMIQPFPFFSVTSIVSAGTNDNNREETSYSNERSPKVISPVAENKKETKAVNIEISFKPTSFTYPENPKKDVGVAEYSAEQLILYAQVLKQYAKKNGYDTSYAFLSNMGMLSSKKRFFVVNLVTMKIEEAGLVAQGRGRGLSRYDKQYSNQYGSKCTSLGRYKIMKKYKGCYGEAYRMAGLDSSNNNAYIRNVVLHAMGCIPDKESTMPACISEGCPAVSPNFLVSLKKIIDTRKKPVLLWIFDSNLQDVVAEPVKSEEEQEDNHHSCALHIPAAHKEDFLP